MGRRRRCRTGFRGGFPNEKQLSWRREAGGSSLHSRGSEPGGRGLGVGGSGLDVGDRMLEVGCLGSKVGGRGSWLESAFAGWRPVCGLVSGCAPSLPGHNWPANHRPWLPTRFTSPPLADHSAVCGRPLNGASGFPGRHVLCDPAHACFELRALDIELQTSNFKPRAPSSELRAPSFEPLPAVPSILLRPVPRSECPGPHGIRLTVACSRPTLLRAQAARGTQWATKGLGIHLPLDLSPFLQAVRTRRSCTRTEVLWRCPPASGSPDSKDPAIPANPYCGILRSQSLPSKGGA
jgi:hypothetical protein